MSLLLAHARSSVCIKATLAGAWAGGGKGELILNLPFGIMLWCCQNVQIALLRTPRCSEGGFSPL